MWRVLVLVMVCIAIEACSESYPVLEDRSDEVWIKHRRPSK